MNRTKTNTQKVENPNIKASFLSKWFFCWTKDLFRKGYNHTIQEDEIYENKPSLNCSELTEKFAKLWDAEEKRSNPSILRVILKAYGFPVIVLGSLFCILETITRVLQPLCLGGLVTYFTVGQSTVSLNTAYIYASGIVLCSLIPVITFHPFIFYIFETSLKVRVGLSGLIYRKILRISKTSSNDGLSGRAINIMSNDLSKFDLALTFLHDLWKGPVESILLGYFMYLEIGFSAVIGVAFMLCFIPLQAWIGKKAAQYRRSTAERTDVRVKLMNEIIQGIQVIKMYAWEKSFASVIEKVRKKEINAIKGTLHIHAALYSTAMISKFAVFFSLVSYVIWGDAITARQVFTVTSFFNILNDSMVHFWPLAITCCAEGYISTKRVREFLQVNEDKPVEREDEESPNEKRNGFAKIPPIIRNESKIQLEVVANGKIKHELVERIVSTNSNKKGVSFKNVSASWVLGKKSETGGILDFNLEVFDSQLCAVVGTVGAGKSTLLNVIIGELPIDAGQLMINGTFSYAAQEPWLFEGSIRDNILFVEEYDEERYHQVVKVCALERDFELLSHGDKTIVGERGISLSGGQKARVNLARAVYKKADIYLLDDPLSAVDAHVAKHLFKKCLRNYLKNKTVILVTHQLQYLKDVELLVLMDEGRIEAQGKYEDLQKLPEFEYLSHAHDETGNPTEKEDVEKKFELLQRQRSIISSVEGDEEEDDRKETQAAGSVTLKVYTTYFKSLNNYYILAFILIMFILARTLLSGIDVFISRWVIWEETLNVAMRSAMDNSTLASELNNSSLLAVTVTVPSLLINESKGILNESLLYGGELFDFGDYTPQEMREIFIIVYTTILIVAFVVYLARTFGFYLGCLRISLTLHDKLFRGVTRAAMSFFNTNPSGRILNRFSKDIHSVDTLLPGALIECLSFFVDITASLLIVCYANFWLLVPALIVLLIFYILRKIYMATSRSLKRIESMTRSPVYSHVNQTFTGLTTIRAFQAEQILEHEFQEHQNLNSSAWYLCIAVSRSFAFWLDTVCVIYIGAVVFSFILLSKNAYSGDVGLAILQCVGMVGMCQWGMRQTAELENQMTSVERVIEYSEIPSEPQLESDENNQPSKKWPQNGKIEFRNLKLRYSEKSDYVLKGLSFVIESEEKVGIVGRTGAGKSSIIQAMFRLAINDGEIIIDGIDVGTLGLHDLRSKISIIPQDPVLFSGKLRYNLDPFEEKSDDEIWRSLEDVELKGHVSQLSGGLNHKMSDGGSNFSMGQRQLVCLARAILRNNKILILDEATANVDPETDKLIQTTIRKKFANCTVITIAHRLHTVMDSDKVLVIDAGQAVEFGHPCVLLEDKGFFSKLVEQTGPATAAVLKQTAETSLQAKKKN